MESRLQKKGIHRVWTFSFRWNENVCTGSFSVTSFRFALWRHIIYRWNRLVTLIQNHISPGVWKSIPDELFSILISRDIWRHEGENNSFLKCRPYYVPLELSHYAHSENTTIHFYNVEDVKRRVLQVNVMLYKCWLLYIMTALSSRSPYSGYFVSRTLNAFT